MIKSYPHGIALHLDADAPFTDILEELEEKLKDASGFFQGRDLRYPLRTEESPRRRSVS